VGVVELDEARWMWSWCTRERERDISPFGWLIGWIGMGRAHALVHCAVMVQTSGVDSGTR
jgi:hypothetical protein